MKISKSVKKKNMEVLAKWNLKQWRYWVKMEKKMDFMSVCQIFQAIIKPSIVNRQFIEEGSLKFT